MATLRTVTVKSSAGDYTTLAAAIAGEQGNLVTLDRRLDIACYASASQSTAYITLSGFTTDATRYVRIYAPTGERHAGVWDAAKFNLALTMAGSNYCLGVSGAGYTRIEGIQIDSNSSVSSGAAVRCQSTSPGCIVDGCLLIRNPSSSGTSQNAATTAGTGDTLTVRNCLLTGWVIGVLGYGQIKLHNNTFVSVGNPFYSTISGGEFVNNLMYLCTSTVYAGTADAALSSVGYNAWSNGTTYWSGHGPYTGDRINQTFSFVDAAGKNYHLQSSDAGAKDHGSDLSAQFTTDVDGDTRSAPWDIGFDEYVAAGGGTFTGSISASLKKLKASSTVQGTNYTVRSGSVSASLKKLSTAVSVTGTASTIRSGSVIASLKKLAAAVSASRTIPTQSASVSASLKKLKASASVTGTNSTVRSGSILASLKRLAASVGISRTVPTQTASVRASLRKLKASASTTYTAPHLDASTSIRASLKRLTARMGLRGPRRVDPEFLVTPRQLAREGCRPPRI